MTAGLWALTVDVRYLIGSLLISLLFELMGGAGRQTCRCGFSFLGNDSLPPCLFWSLVDLKVSRSPVLFYALRFAKPYVSPSMCNWCPAMGTDWSARGIDCAWSDGGWCVFRCRQYYSIRVGGWSLGKRGVFLFIFIHYQLLIRLTNKKQVNTHMMSELRPPIKQPQPVNLGFGWAYLVNLPFSNNEKQSPKYEGLCFYDPWVTRET